MPFPQRYSPTSLRGKIRTQRTTSSSPQTMYCSRPPPKRYCEEARKVNLTLLLVVVEPRLRLCVEYSALDPLRTLRSHARTHARTIFAKIPLFKDYSSIDIGICSENDVAMTSSELLSKKDVGEFPHALLRRRQGVYKQDSDGLDHQAPPRNHTKTHTHTHTLKNQKSVLGLAMWCVKSPACAKQIHPYFGWGSSCVGG